MAVKRAGRREFAELVTDHVLGHQHRDELLAVVNAEGQADELRQDRRAARPGLDDLIAAGAARGLRLLQQIAVDERAFPDRTGHVFVLLLLFPPADDEPIARLRPLARALALGRLAPGRHRMPAARGAALAEI